MFKNRTKICENSLKNHTTVCKNTFKTHTEVCENTFKYNATIYSEIASKIYLKKKTENDQKRILKFVG